jgi:Carboxypeptidase regulatory-like domain
MYTEPNWEIRNGIPLIVSWGSRAMWSRIVIVSIILCALAVAQVDTGTISGLVRDTSGGGIPSVQVTLRGEDTGLSTEISTNSTGLFVSPPLRAGTYVVTARAKGFESAAKRVRLDLSERLEVDFDLAVGAVSETVAVKDVASTLQTETSTLSNLRSEQAVKDLPLNSRNFAQLITLSPGAMPAQSQTTGSPITMKRGSTGVSLNGTRLEENNFLVDGILNNENHNGGSADLSQRRRHRGIPRGSIGRQRAVRPRRRRHNQPHL